MDLPVAPSEDFDNCEPFADNLQVSWTVDTDNSEVDFEICSCRPVDAGYALRHSPLVSRRPSHYLLARLALTSSPRP